MKYYITAVVLCLLAMPVKAQSRTDLNVGFSFDSGVIPVENFSVSKKGADFLEVLESKFIDAQQQSGKAKMSEESAKRVEAFLKRYDSKVKEAAGNSEYQSKLAKFKKTPMPHKKLVLDTGYGTSTQAEEFHKLLVKLREKFWARIRVVRLIVPNSAFPKRYQGIYYDEHHSELLLREYYRYSTQCLYNTLDTDTCSYIASARAKNMVNIATISIEVEDMPVFYAAMDELSKILSKTVKKDSLRFLFTNSADLGI